MAQLTARIESIVPNDGRVTTHDDTGEEIIYQERYTVTEGTTLSISAGTTVVFHSNDMDMTVTGPRRWKLTATEIAHGTPHHLRPGTNVPQNRNPRHPNPDPRMPLPEWFARVYQWLDGLRDENPQFGSEIQNLRDSLKITQDKLRIPTLNLSQHSSPHMQIQPHEKINPEE